MEPGLNSRSKPSASQLLSKQHIPFSLNPAGMPMKIPISTWNLPSWTALLELLPEVMLPSSALSSTHDQITLLSPIRHLNSAALLFRAPHHQLSSLWSLWRKCPLGYPYIPTQQTTSLLSWFEHLTCNQHEAPLDSLHSICSPCPHGIVQTSFTYPPWCGRAVCIQAPQRLWTTQNQDLVFITAVPPQTSSVHLAWNLADIRGDD